MAEIDWFPERPYHLPDLSHGELMDIISALRHFGCQKLDEPASLTPRMFGELTEALITDAGVKKQAPITNWDENGFPLTKTVDYSYLETRACIPYLLRATSGLSDIIYDYKLIIFSRLQLEGENILVVQYVPHLEAAGSEEGQIEQSAVIHMYLNRNLLVFFDGVHTACERSTLEGLSPLASAHILDHLRIAAVSLVSYFENREGDLPLPQAFQDELPPLDTSKI